MKAGPRRALLRSAALLALLPAAVGRAQVGSSRAGASAAAPAASSTDAPLARIDDLRPLLAGVARERRPLLLFFSTPGCPYCREVRRSYLRPRVEEGEAASGVAIREVEITSSRRLRDAVGATITEGDLAARYGVKMVPHLEFVDSRAERLIRPLIGLDSSGFYESFLQGAIRDATARLPS
jgi:thiol-disulfide isomerase/thioredoxin